MTKKTNLCLLLVCMLFTSLLLGGCSKGGSSSGGFSVIVLGQIGHGKSEVTASIASAYGKSTSVDDLNSAKECKSNGVTYRAASVSVKSDARSYTIYDLPDYNDICKGITSKGIEPSGAILVVSAQDGIMPQTLENIEMLKDLGIKNIVVYISKASNPDDSSVEILKTDIGSLLPGVNEYIVDCDNFSTDNAKKTVSVMDKWKDENNGSSVSGATVNVYGYLLTAEEGGKNYPFSTGDEVDIKIGSKTYKGKVASVVGDMLMPGDEAKIAFELDESVSAKTGDKVTAENSGGASVVGVVIG